LHRDQDQSGNEVVDDAIAFSKEASYQEVYAIEALHQQPFKKLKTQDDVKRTLIDLH
jgi:hypothetical protein